jgi:peptidoglycan-N-acetylglucosamine deacetylase
MSASYILCSLLFLSACNNNPTNPNPKDSAQKTKEALVVKDTPAPAPKAWIAPTYDSTKKYIYLTFDDGPQPGTMICYNLCKELGIKATFFMVGRHGSSDKWGRDIVTTIRNSYPQILLTNHSYTHANEHYQYFYQHPDMAEQDFYKAQDSLKVPYKIIRLPGNSAWVRKGEIKSSNLVNAVCKRLDATGYNVIGWDVEWNFSRDGKCHPVQSPEKLAAQVNDALSGKWSHTKNHVMILTHDRMFKQANYTDSLRKFITLLKQNPNYVFETVDRYPNLKMP